MNNNPFQVVQMAMKNNKVMQNPMFSNAVNMFGKNDVKGLEKMAINLCKEKNVNLEELRKTLGI